MKHPYKIPSLFRYPSFKNCVSSFNYLQLKKTKNPFEHKEDHYGRNLKEEL